MNKIFAGIEYFIAGLGLISKPGLRRFVIIPLCINIVFFVGLFFLVRHYMGEFNQWTSHVLPTWLSWLSAFIWLLFFAAYFLLLVYAFVTIANIISAPFNSFLAENVELYLTGKMLQPRSLMENIRDFPRIVGRQLAILVYYLPRALVLLILFFVPIIQTVAPFLWFIFHAWYMTLTYLDYPTDNHRVSLKDVRVYLQQNPWLVLGFGLSALLASMIPVINLFAIPAAVAGATKLWVEENKLGAN